MTSAFRITVALFVFLLLPDARLASAQDIADIERTVAACRADPAYAIGGANIGDCLRDVAEKIEPQVATMLHRTAKNLCSSESRRHLRAAQTAWRDYRDVYCSLVENSPGNTPAYVNASMCRLQLTRQRQDALALQENRTFQNCIRLSHQFRASSYGAPDSRGVEHPASEIGWSRSADGRELRITAGGAPVFAVSVAGCGYCETGEDCSQGVFLFRYPEAEATRPTPYDIDYALLHACRKPGGIAFDLVSGLKSTPQVALSGAGLDKFDWVIDYDRITFSGMETPEPTQWIAPLVGE